MPSNGQNTRAKLKITTPVSRPSIKLKPRPAHNSQRHGTPLFNMRNFTHELKRLSMTQTKSHVVTAHFETKQAIKDDSENIIIAICVDEPQR